MEKIQNSIKTIIQECKIKHENIDEVAKKASEKMIQNFSGYGVDVAGLFSNKIKNEHR